MNSAGAPGVFIAGTDTGVGKTRVTLGLIRALRAGGVGANGMKPIASGMIAKNGAFINEDTHAIAELNGGTYSPADITPYCFDWAVSPHIAAERAGIVIDVGAIAAAYARLSTGSTLLVVEGTGGWLTPIGAQTTMADVARALDLPVVLVVGLRLGCLNHALLSAQAIAQAGASLIGWIGSVIDPAMPALTENLATLQKRLPAAQLSLLPHAPDSGQDSTWLAPAARALMTRALPLA
jgi:dethiobiotin synthetase